MYLLSSASASNISQFDRTFIEEAHDPNLVEDDNIEQISDTSPFDVPHLFKLFLCYLGDVWLDYLAEKPNFSAQRAEFMGIFGARMEEGRLALEENRETIAQLTAEAEELKQHKVRVLYSVYIGAHFWIG